MERTLEKLELSYMSLESEYKEMFLDIACILKGQTKEDAIRVLECCEFHARNGLKVLEQRSLITVDEDGRLDMHQRIEEMGKNIVRREHPDEPNKHSRLWIQEEIEDILANDMGTEATRCLKLTESNRNARIVMKGLGKMKKLRYLQVNFYDKSLGSQKLDDTTQYFPNSLKYLSCWDYPFLYLPKTFQANNLVGLEMESIRRMVQLWEEEEEKILNKLKFLTLCGSNLTTFDLRITPNLETLSLENSGKLEELCMPDTCQKLKHLNISHSKLRTFDLGLTPYLETLSLSGCADFEELHVSGACPNLKFLNLSSSRLRSLDLELIPNFESLDLRRCHELVEINAPVGCLKKVVRLNLSGCELLEKLPEDIGRSECLKELDITDTCISHLPQSIFGLKGLLIAASSELLELYDFPSEIKTTTSSIRLEMSSSASSNNTDEMIEQQMSTSSSSIQKSFKYDVFISFRGEDTVNSFVDHLYKALDDKGICTYKDDERIQKGERISDDLIKAIEDSKFHIIVFSKNYASSSWCLEELVKILECHKMPGHTAYPVFYDVKRTEVRDQRGAVVDAFSEHENQEATGRWKGALKEAADLDGWELELNTLEDQDKFIKKIVDKMSLELHFGFDANSVGMVTRVKDVVTPATVLNKLVEAIGSVTAFLGKLWATYYPSVVEVDLTPGSAFSFIIWCLLVFTGLKSQSVTGFPFKTHPNAIKVPVTSLLIYAFASMAELVVEVAGLYRTSVYAIIARLGRISSLCLFVTSLAILIYI